MSGTPAISAESDPKATAKLRAKLRRRAIAFSLRTTFHRFSADQCLDMAAALTYYAVLASAPAALALVSILGLVPNGDTATTKVLDLAESVVPADVLAVLDPLVKQLSDNAEQAGPAFVIGLVGALWSASGYVGAFGRAMNQVYQVSEGRPAWKLRPLLLLVTLLLVLLAAIVAGTMVLTGSFAKAIGDAIGLGGAALTAWGILKWPVVLLLMVIIVALLYHATPNVRQPRFRLLSTGALVAILAWVIASVAFGFYVANFSSYATTYGALATVIVFLLWLWITNVFLLLGAELDAELERGRQLRDGIAAEETLQLPAQDTRNLTKRERKRAQDIERGRAIREAARSLLDAETTQAAKKQEQAVQAQAAEVQAAREQAAQEQAAAEQAAQEPEPAAPEQADQGPERPAQEPAKPAKEPAKPSRDEPGGAPVTHDGDESGEGASAHPDGAGTEERGPGRHRD